MSEFRDKLMSQGWQQGSIISSESLTDLPEELSNCPHFLILSQTCDVLSHNLNSEPTVELLPLKLLPKQKPDKNLANTYNPRRIQFQISIEGNEKWVESSIKDILLYPREKLEHFAPKASVEISPSRLRDLCIWRAARYLRPAFPETFEDALKTKFVSKNSEEKIVFAEFQALVAEHHALLGDLMITLEPEGELADGDFYTVKIIILMKPQLYAVPSNLATVKQVAKDIKTLLKKVDAFDSDSLSCEIFSTAQFTLEQASHYTDWSRYDYLSFGQT